MIFATALLLLSTPLFLATSQTFVLQAAELTPEEIAFAARLHDAHRKFFVEKLTPSERKEVMETAKSSLSADSGDHAIAECRISKEKKMSEVQ